VSTWSLLHTLIFGFLNRCSPEPAAAEQQHQHNDQHDQAEAAEAATAIVPTTEGKVNEVAKSAPPASPRRLV
jgi:hypothetical protein